MNKILERGYMVRVFVTLLHTHTEKIHLIHHKIKLPFMETYSAN